MKNPFTYRPHPYYKDVDWEDNWVSNAMAYFAIEWVDGCSNEEQWHVRLSNVFWTDCGCCMFYRGVLVGAVVMETLSMILKGLI